MYDPSGAPLQNGFYAAGRLVLLNANHFMSLFCSKPFIGFLHIQSTTFLKYRKDLAPATALSLFFFFFTSHLYHSHLLSQPPPPTPDIDTVASLLFARHPRKNTLIPELCMCCSLCAEDLPSESSIAQCLTSVRCLLQYPLF